MQFRQFDFQQCENMDSIVIIGKRAVGKTVLVRDLLLQSWFQNRHFIVFNPTESEKDGYGDIVPRHAIHEDYEEETLQEFVTEQNARVSEYIEKKQSDYTINVPPPQGCVVFDGCMYNLSCWKHKPLRQLYMNVKSLRTKIILAVQYPIGLPPDLRSTIDYVFIFRENIMSNRKRIYDQYGEGIFPTFEVFGQVFEQLTKDPFTCMVINLAGKSDKLEERVMWYKAHDEPPWKVMVDKKTKWLDQLREELMQNTWHPRRLKQCLEYDELAEVLGSPMYEDIGTTT